MSDWNYGGAYERHPIESGTALFSDGSKLKAHDIFDPIPDFMMEADLLFIDPPWNKGNLTSFYTKAGFCLPPVAENFGSFYYRLFECISTIKPKTLYIEIGKEFLAEFVIEIKKMYKYVTFYNSSYYHSRKNICYVIRASNKAKRPKLDWMDEEDIINWIGENEECSCMGDLCMGRGLVAMSAARNGKRFVGTELNHKRLSVAIERLSDIGMEYSIES